MATDPEKAERYRRLYGIAIDLIDALGGDVGTPGLQGTPARFAKWWQDFIEYEDSNTETVFAVEQSDQMVVVKGIRVWSICEHHLLPFWCDVTMGYVAREQVLGLSKFARIAQLYAHRLQLQERLTQQIAAHLRAACKTEDVAVLAEGEHLCMTMRGAKSPHRMKSSVLRGVFRADPAARQEFFYLAGGSYGG